MIKKYPTKNISKTVGQINRFHFTGDDITRLKEVKLLNRFLEKIEKAVQI
jgi:hypothetical protein